MIKDSGEWQYFCYSHEGSLISEYIIFFKKDVDISHLLNEKDDNGSLSDKGFEILFNLLSEIDQESFMTFDLNLGEKFFKTISLEERNSLRKIIL